MHHRVEDVPFEEHQNNGTDENEKLSEPSVAHELNLRFAQLVIDPEHHIGVKDQHDASEHGRHDNVAAAFFRVQFIS